MSMLSGYTTCRGFLFAQRASVSACSGTCQLSLRIQQIIPIGHDHVIRNADEYERIQKYILENTQKWNEDRYYAL